jgi:hypothetical protein
MPHDCNGRWRNEVGSEMALEVQGGVVRGTYHTAVGRPGAGDGFPVRGVLNGDMLAMTVDFGAHDSVAAWTGRVVTDDDGDRIHTLWHLVRDRSDAGEPLPPWSSTLAGAAVFRRLRRP